jgi:hypothetical protein
MTFIYITIGAIVMCLFLLVIAVAIDSHNLGLASSFVLLISIIAFIVGSLYLNLDAEKEIEKSTPTAMDVYRGNTTLEITYRDGMPVDSVIVFKQTVYGE